jgi:chromosome segregation ATPase
MKEEEVKFAIHYVTENRWEGTQFKPFKKEYVLLSDVKTELQSLRDQLAQQKYDNENAWKGVKQVCAEKYELTLEIQQLKDQLAVKEDELNTEQHLVRVKQKQLECANIAKEKEEIKSKLTSAENTLKAFQFRQRQVSEENKRLKEEIHRGDNQIQQLKEQLRLNEKEVKERLEKYFESLGEAKNEGDDEYRRGVANAINIVHSYYESLKTEKTN